MSSTTSKTFRAYRPGNWKIQATVRFSDGKVIKSNVAEVIIQNPLYSKIMNVPEVISKMDALWAVAVQAASNNLPSYREKGCWILLNTEYNAYEFIDVQDSPEFVCEGTTSIQFPDPGIRPKHPNEGGRYIVGTFHTHPARTMCDNTKTYLVGPSEIDRNMNTVCLLYEYVGSGSGWVKGGHYPSERYKLYHYGTEKDNPCGRERHPVYFN